MGLELGIERVGVGVRIRVSKSLGFGLKFVLGLELGLRLVRVTFGIWVGVNEGWS